MKTVIISIGLCLIGFVTMAQNVDEVNDAAYVNKRGVYLLPQAGDFALGVEATPVLKDFGNLFLGDFSGAGFTGINETVYGKYFLEDNRAIRARFTLNLLNTKHQGVVPNDAIFEDDPDATLVDVLNISRYGVELGVGYEFRRGHGRVQGFYGGEVSVGYSSGKEKYNYGNRMTEDFPSPSTFNFNDLDLDWNLWPGWDMQSNRPTEIKYGKTFSGGLGAFVGVEYFFAPKMSIGGELGYGVYFRSWGQGQAKGEKWEDEERQTYTDKAQAGDWGKSHDLGFITRPSGNIFLMFHF
jgi:hypothetical protein